MNKIKNHKVTLCSSFVKRLQINKPEVITPTTIKEVLEENVSRKVEYFLFILGC